MTSSMTCNCHPVNRQQWLMERPTYQTVTSRGGSSTRRGAIGCYMYLDCSLKPDLRSYSTMAPKRSDYEIVCGHEDLIEFSQEHSANVSLNGIELNDSSGVHGHAVWKRRLAVGAGLIAVVLLVFLRKQSAGPASSSLRPTAAWTSVSSAWVR